MRARLFTSLVCAIASLTAAAQSAPPFQTPSPSDLIQSYSESGASARTRLLRGRDVEAILPAMRGWVDGVGGREWPVATAVLCVDLADAATRAEKPSLAAIVDLLRWGREAIASRPAQADVRFNRDLEKQIHQTALAVLQGLRAHQAQQDYIDAISERMSSDWSPRLWIARGVALEQKAMAQAGKSGPPTATSLAPFGSQLDEAARLYDRAARDLEVRSEASARSASIFEKLGRFRDALRRLEIAGDTTTDVDVAAWLAHLRARVWAGLKEPAEASVALERAQQLSPADPSPSFEIGDARFVPEWLDRLRGVFAPVAAGPSRSAVMMALDLYEAGAHGEVAADLVSKPLAPFSKELQSVAEPWAKDRGPVKLDERRRLVAGLVLEAAHARGGAEWAHAQVLLEWECERLRLSLTPTEPERAWMHAAASLMAAVVAGALLEVHAAHALKRFPNDPALTMALAVAAEQRAGPDERTSQGLKPPGSTSTLPVDRDVLLMSATPSTMASTMVTTPNTGVGLALAIKRFERLTTIDAYRDEAKVRLGYSALRLNKPDLALTHLDGVASTVTDTYLAYLAHLFRGRALDRLGRLDDAIVEYRAAVAIQPGAQSAELALAAALSRAGKRVEAASVADRALQRAEVVPDPWLAYGQSDFRHWPKLIERVRKGMR